VILTNFNILSKNEILVSNTKTRKDFEVPLWRDDLGWFLFLVDLFLSFFGLSDDGKG
jgi:hypothetical protein